MDAKFHLRGTLLITLEDGPGARRTHWHLRRQHAKSGFPTLCIILRAGPASTVRKTVRLRGLSRSCNEVSGRMRYFVEVRLFQGGCRTAFCQKRNPASANDRGFSNCGCLAMAWVSLHIFEGTNIDSSLHYLPPGTSYCALRKPIYRGALFRTVYPLADCTQLDQDVNLAVIS